MTDEKLKEGSELKSGPQTAEVKGDISQTHWTAPNSGKWVECPDCDDGENCEHCQWCDGNGQIPCQECDGEGSRDCEECEGEGGECKNCSDGQIECSCWGGMEDCEACNNGTACHECEKCDGAGLVQVTEELK